jgi:hypothetical protein
MVGWSGGLIVERVNFDKCMQRNEMTATEPRTRDAERESGKTSIERDSRCVLPENDVGYCTVRHVLLLLEQYLVSYLVTKIQ